MFVNSRIIRGRNPDINMKPIIALFIFTFFATCPYVMGYDEKFDEIDIEGIVAHPIVHKSVNDCVLGIVQCGPYWDEVREIAKEIASDHCAKCSPRQKKIVKMYKDATKKNYPETWKKIYIMFKRS